MPSNAKKTRKTRCCTSCGRRTKGHLVQTGNGCRMDELLRKELDDIPDLNEKGDHAKKGRHCQGAVKPGSMTDEEPAENPLVQDQLSVLTKQVGLLVSTVSKLLSKEEVIQEGAGAHVLVKPLSGTKKQVILDKVPAKVTVADSDGSEDLPTTKSLSRDRELYKLLQIYNRGDQDFLETLDADKTAKSSTHGEKPKKHFCIPDFITRVDSSINDQEDILLTTSSGKLTFNTGVSKKIEVKDVKIGQWIGANSRIFDVLESSLSRYEIMAYKEYTRQVGDLFQLYTEPSVMQLDNEHRRLVNKTGHTWSEILLHLERLFLKIKHTDQGVVQSAQNDKFKGAKKSGNACFAFNTKSGCKRGDTCHYKHVCSAQLGDKICREQHSKCDHDKFHPPAQQA
jgi:hypothetical protein